MNWTTADLCDDHIEELQIAEPVFRCYGARQSFSGQAATLEVFEDNSLVRQACESTGDGQVLVVDGGGSLRCALVGDLLAKLAIDNGWAGLVVNGAIRDSGPIAEMPIGIRALATCPRKSLKRGQGERNVVLTFAGVNIAPGAWIYADQDGIVVAPRSLS
jgi:regulator of ribonuclease activity A